jgi:hypothetical protein
MFAEIFVDAVVAVALIAICALLADQDSFGRVFGTFAFLAFLLGVLTREWSLAIGTLIGAPVAIAITMGIKSLRGKR